MVIVAPRRETDVTPLEVETFSNGFRLCLLDAVSDRALDLLECRVTVYDGGRKTDEAHVQTSWSAPTASVWSRIRALVMQAVAPPHVLVAHGRGWSELLERLLSAPERDRFQILRLRETALALADSLAAGANLLAIARAYEVSMVAPADSALSPSLEDVLWAVLHRAGARGLDWTGFLDLADRRRSAPSYERYAFGQALLANLPNTPAVYVMRDMRAQPLYVGKTADLGRRMTEYFRALHTVPDKIRRLRDRVFDLDFHDVGSDLEALLLESRLIRELRPEVNVQQHVAEGASRYGPPLLPVVLIQPSAARGKAELFFFGDGLSAVQVRVDAKRPPRKTIANVVAAYSRRRDTFRRTACVTDWNREGAEICCRYFGRYRNRVRWMEIGSAAPPPRITEAFLDIVTRVALHAPDPAEFRIGDADG